MSVKKTGQIISDITRRLSLPWDEQEHPHRQLFQLYVSTANMLAHHHKASPFQDNPSRIQLLELQDDIMRQASAIPAASNNELLFKLAIWRWGRSEQCLSKPSEAVVYSAFRDLADRLTDYSVLNQSDHHNRAS
jgi:hypothetical protein